MKLTDQQRAELKAMAEIIDTRKFKTGNADERLASGYLALLADLEEAQAKLAAAEKDAERYQFLETRAYVGVNPHHKTCMWVLRGIFELPGQSFEVAIDTAIAVGKEQP